jgi:hypothetical protein
VVTMLILLCAFDLTLAAYLVLTFNKVKAPCDFVLEELFVDITTDDVEHGVHGSSKTTYISQ